MIQSRNYLPQKVITRKRIGANTILLGSPNSYFNTKRISFGPYAMVYTGTKNNMKRRSIPSIALRKSKKDGESLFIPLYNRKEIHSENWMELPMYDDVVNIV